MTITLSNVIYAIVYIISIAGVFFAFKNRLNNLERENGQVRKILFGDRGTLNLVSVEQCKEHRDEIFAAIRRSEQVNQMLLASVEELKKHVLLIMFHLNIKSPNGISLNAGKKD